MQEGTASQQPVVRIGVLDNAHHQLDCVIALLSGPAGQNERPRELWFSINPIDTVQRCQCLRTPTHIVLINMALPGRTGTHVAAAIRNANHSIGIIAIASSESASCRRELQDAGAQALLEMSSLNRTLSGALRAVLRGHAYPEHSGFRSISAAASHLPMVTRLKVSRHLTETEQRIVMLSLARINTKQIARALHVSTATVFSHRRNIKNKLGTDTWNDVLEHCRPWYIV